jgi:hypothetical protein
MKQLIFKVFFVVVIGSLCPFRSIHSQTDYTTPFTLSITSTGINRYLASQWSSMTEEWSGNYQGISYSISLQEPTISLTTNTLKILLKLSISSSIYDGSITLTPTLTIPSTTISAEQIISKYTDLHQQIIKLTSIDTRLQNVIEQLLAPIDWIIYKGKAIDASTTRLTESADISLKGIPTLTFNISNDELNIIITPTITATPPSLSFQWMRSASNFGIKIISNDKLTVGYAKIDDIYNSLGQKISFTLTSPLPTDASYDPNLQEYTAEYYFQGSSTLASGLNLYTRVYLKRGGTETIYTLNFQTLTDDQPDWTSNATQVGVIRGE